MAVRAVGPFAPGLPRMAAPMGLQEACRPQAAGPRRVAFWPGARAVLNCDLVPQGPAVLQIFFRIGPVQEFRYGSGKFPFGLNGPDRFCRGGSGHSGFHLKAGRHPYPFNRAQQLHRQAAKPPRILTAKQLRRGCRCLVGVVCSAAQAGMVKVG